MKKNNAFTIVELLVCFVLITIVSVSLFKTVLSLQKKQQRNVSYNSYIAFASTLNSLIQKDFLSKTIISFDTCGDNCYDITYEGETTTRLSIDNSTGILIYGSNKGQIPKNYKFEGNMSIDNTTVSNVDNGFDSILTLNIPIKSTFNDEINNLKYVYQCNELDNYITDGLKIWYDGIKNSESGHDSSSTTWKNLAGSTYTGTLVNNPTWGENYLNFEGTNNYVAIDQLNQNKYTIEIITTPTLYTTELTVLVGNYENGGFGIETKEGKFRNFAYINGAYVQALAPNIYTVNTTYSVVATFDGFDLKLYIDGVEVAMWSTNNETLIGYPENATIMAIGANPYGTTASGNEYKAKIYSVRIYDRSLSLEEIQRNYQMDKLRFGL